MEENRGEKGRVEDSRDEVEARRARCRTHHFEVEPRAELMIRDERTGEDRKVRKMSSSA